MESERALHININVVNGSIFSEESFYGVPLRTIRSILITNSWHVYWCFTESSKEFCISMSQLSTKIIIMY